MPPPNKSLSLQYQDEGKVGHSKVSHIVHEKLLNLIYYYQSTTSSDFSTSYTDEIAYPLRFLINTTFIILK